MEIRLLGDMISLAIRVLNEEIQKFLNEELPGLTQRLTGLKLHVEQCECRIAPDDSADIGTSVPPAPPLDMKV